jgi:hypothetical protein
MGNSKNFRKEWKTMTELGLEFGMSAVKFGNSLKQHGLREKSGEPTEIAVNGGFIQHIVPKRGKPYFLWHRKKTSSYLVNLGLKKSGVSAKEASKNTEARKLAKAYMEALKLDEEGSKAGYMMLCEMVDEIKELGLEQFNQTLKSIGYKGDEVTLEGW